MKHRNAKKKKTWMSKIGEDYNGLHSGKFEKRQLDYFQVYLNLQ